MVVEDGPVEGRRAGLVDGGERGAGEVGKDVVDNVCGLATVNIGMRKTGERECKLVLGPPLL